MGFGFDFDFDLSQHMLKIMSGSEQFPSFHLKNGWIDESFLLNIVGFSVQTESGCT